jgi:hypothetical protein
MSDNQEAVRAQLRTAAEELTKLSFRLGALAAVLPVSPAEKEIDADLEEAPELPVALRAALLCILVDSIAPAIRGLWEAADGPAGQTAARPAERLLLAVSGL